MKRIILLSAAILLASLFAKAQENSENETSFELGSGVNFDLNDGAYKFKLSGMMQPYYAFEQVGDEDPDYFFNSKRTYLNFGGEAVEEKVSFFFQVDFTQPEPLLDAWIKYNPFGEFNVTVGQMQNISNNREMLHMEDHLTFPDRSLLSTSLSNTGRELGLFIDNTFGDENFAVIPHISVTSGDGRNSFGADSRDVDLGGLKYGARIDLFPLGMFTKGNEGQVADLMHEESPKVLLGAAASYNDGASNTVGEGHGDYFLYDAAGEVQLPDYRQLYFDILAKYKGFSVLGEYAIATATSLDGSFVDPTATEFLRPTQISQYLTLGTAYNAQLGYVTKSGYALDLRYSALTPEFGDNEMSVAAETTAMTVGFSKYFKENALKIQAAVTTLDNERMEDNTLTGQLLFQLIF
ncbi:hypothetical protein [Halocola ammonii]